MSYKILQISPAPSHIRIVYYDPDNVDLIRIDTPTCLALVEKGSSKEVVYMETESNNIDFIDTDDKTFLSFVEVNDNSRIEELRTAAQIRYNKEVP